MLIRERQTKSLFKRWISCFIELDKWIQEIETLPVSEFFDQSDISGEL